MKIGLVDVDSKIPNLALMKISMYHKTQGDDVKFFDPLFDKPDQIYVSKIFTWSPEPDYLPADIETFRGGSGYFRTDNRGLYDLPEYIEETFPDYSLYPDMDYSLGYTSRGCPWNCPFCIVPEKFGKQRVVAEIDKFRHWQFNKIVLFDDNILSIPGHFEGVAEDIQGVGKDVRGRGLAVDFNQGLDIQFMTADRARILKGLRRLNLWRFAFDFTADEDVFRAAAEMLSSAGIYKKTIQVYILAGYQDTIEDVLYRINIVYGEYGFNPFVMLYRPLDGSVPEWEKSEFADEYLKMARWADCPEILRSVPWEQYRTEKRNRSKWNSHPDQAMLFDTKPEDA